MRAIVERRVAEIPGAQLTETVDTTTMVRVPDPDDVRTKVVELRGVRPEFPFYGRFELADGRPYDYRMLEGHGALVGFELLAQLGVEVGDAIAIGDVEFTIRGAIFREPGRQLGGFSFGPRVLVTYEAVEETGLLTFASRASRQYLLRVPDEGRIDPLVETFREDLERRLRAHGVLPSHGESHRAQPGAGGELPEPDRVRGRHPRGHRGVERDAGVRAAASAQRRDPQVSGRHHPARPVGLRAPGRGAGAGRKRARHRCRLARSARDSGVAGERGGGVARHGRSVRHGDRVGRRPGAGRGRPRLVALLAGSVARRPGREAAPAAPSGSRRRPTGHRPAQDRDHRPRGGGAGRRGELAGGLARDRCVCRRRVRRRRGGALRSREAARRGHPAAAVQPVVPVASRGSQPQPTRETRPA